MHNARPDIASDVVGTERICARATVECGPSELVEYVGVAGVAGGDDVGEDAEDEEGNHDHERRHDHCRATPAARPPEAKSEARLNRDVSDLFFRHQSSAVRIRGSM